jgi:uncharacterized membrane protein YfcA
MLTIMAEYRITIGGRRQDSQQGGHRPRGRLEVLKAAVFTVLSLSAVVGILLAAFVVGSIIASLLLILIAVSVIAWAIRYLSSKFREQTKS